LINKTNFNRIKKGAVIICSTWGIIDDSIIPDLLNKDIVSSISFDAAVEGDSKISLKLERFKEQIFFAPHIAYNTFESEMRQLDICVNNILSFVEGHPRNIVR